MPINKEDKNYLDVKLAQLETQSDERWKAHDARGKELKEDLKSTLDCLFDQGRKIYEELKTRPCLLHKEQLNGLDSKVNWLFKLVVSVIMLGIVLGIWVKYFLMGG